MEVCPSCKKKHKNLILHIKKSTKCKNNVSEEEMKILKDQSKNRRRQYQKMTMKERRKKVKDETKERKEDKEHKEDMIDTEENEVPKKCPICNARKQNILLHIKTKKTCFMKIDKQVFEKWSKMARCITQKAQNRKSKEKKEATYTSEEKTLKNAAKSKSYETLKEMQNRWKAKSREKARQNDHAAVRKYQREATLKCRDKQKKEDPELYKARQLMWNLKRKPVNSHNIMKVSKILLQNYHRLNNDDTDTEDEDKYGLTVGRQIRILNDKSMNDEEKRNKLESIWDQTKKMMDEDEIYVKEQEVKKEKSNKITMLRRELKKQREKEKKEKVMRKRQLMKMGIEDDGLGLWDDGCWNRFQRINSYDVKITWAEEQQIRKEGKYCLWNNFVKEKRLEEKCKDHTIDPYHITLYKMRQLRKLRESGETAKLEWRNGKWRRENITDESEDEMEREWEKFKNQTQSGKFSRKYEDESEDSDDTEDDQEESEDSDDTEEDQKIDNKKNYVTNEEEFDEENDK